MRQNFETMELRARELEAMLVEKEVEVEQTRQAVIEVMEVCPSLLQHAACVTSRLV